MRSARAGWRLVGHFICSPRSPWTRRIGLVCVCMCMCMDQAWTCFAFGVSVTNPTLFCILKINYYILHSFSAKMINATCYCIRTTALFSSISSNKQYRQIHSLSPLSTRCWGGSIATIPVSARSDVFQRALLPGRWRVGLAFIANNKYKIGYNHMTFVAPFRTPQSRPRLASFSCLPCRVGY